jgi:hypothetical protein
MNDEISAVCQKIDKSVVELGYRAVRFDHSVLEIMRNEWRDVWCSEDTVVNLIPDGDVDRSEDWGAAVVDLANHYPWEPGYARLIIVVSDEGPEDGAPERDPGPDRDVIEEACTVAQESGVVVSPLQGTAIGSTGDPDQVATFMQDLASCTGGFYSPSTISPYELARRIADLIETSQ